MGNTQSKKSTKQKPKPWLFSFGFPTAVVSKEITRNSKHRQIIDKERNELYSKLLELKPHPCVIRIYDNRVYSTTCVTIMERMFGGELFSFIKSPSSRNLKESQIKNVIRPILLGLCHLHSNGIVHRDVKPENIMFRTKRKITDPIEKDLDLVIIDLDSSAVIDSPLRKEEIKHCRFFGTPAYTSPEVLSGELASPASDLWAVGIMLYIFLTGTPPMQMKSMNSVKAALNTILKQKEIGINYQKPIFCVSVLAYEFCTRLLAFDPLKRFEDAGQALRHPWIDDGSYMRYLREYQNISNVSDPSIEVNSTVSTSSSLYLDTQISSSPISNSYERNIVTHKHMVEKIRNSNPVAGSADFPHWKNYKLSFSLEQSDEKYDNVNTYFLQSQMCQNF